MTDIAFVLFLFAILISGAIWCLSVGTTFIVWGLAHLLFGLPKPTPWPTLFIGSFITGSFCFWYWFSI